MTSALHIGDLHFWRFPRNPMHLAGKRLLGVGNLALRRARKFHQHRHELLTARVSELRPDVLLCSGDFTTTALASEYRAAREALDRANVSRVLAVPGNHDRYTRRCISGKTFEAHLADWCEGGTWPYFVELSKGHWLLGLDATTSNGMGSHGRVEPATVQALHSWRRGAGRDAVEAWVLCHFPAEVPGGGVVEERAPQLHRADALSEFLVGLDIPVLFLHGHYHARWAYRGRRAPNVTYLNAGAPMQRGGHGHPDLGFLQLHRAQGATRVDLHECDVPHGRWSSRQVELPTKSGEFVPLCPRASRRH